MKVVDSEGNVVEYVYDEVGNMPEIKLMVFLCMPSAALKKLLCQRVQVWSLFFLISLFCVQPGVAQDLPSFDSGSDESDGDLIITTTPGTPITVDFDPGQSGPDLGDDQIYHYRKIMIGAEVTLRMTEKTLNGPVFWLASEDVQIDGIIDLSGEQATGTSSTGVPLSIAVPGAGGFLGGHPGIRTGSGPHGGIGGTGGAAQNCPAQTGGGGAATTNNFLVPLIGGSGGGASCLDHSGGPGGGAMLIASSDSITVNGTIRANGGNAFPTGGPAAGGSGGGGGGIRLVASQISGSGRLEAKGGDGGGGLPFSRGGGIGLVRLEAFQHNFTGISNSLIRRTPVAVFLPTTPAPSIRVVSVNGIPVPALSTGSFDVADVQINTDAPVTVLIEGRNIPPGTTGTLPVFTEEGAGVGGPFELTGTLDLTQATIEIDFPPGFTRAYVRAMWDLAP